MIPYDEKDTLEKLVSLFVEKIPKHIQNADAKNGNSKIQRDTRSLRKAWTRFNETIFYCNGHKFNELSLMSMFNLGLRIEVKGLINAMTRRGLMNVLVEESKDIIEGR